jgi:hypothetical protein
MSKDVGPWSNFNESKRLGQPTCLLKIGPPPSADRAMATALGALIGTAEHRGRVFVGLNLKCDLYVR